VTGFLFIWTKVRSTKSFTCKLIGARLGWECSSVWGLSVRGGTEDMLHSEAGDKGANSTFNEFVVTNRSIEMPKGGEEYYCKLTSTAPECAFPIYSSPIQPTLQAQPWLNVL
jgi:hypothetical protein